MKHRKRHKALPRGRVAGLAEPHPGRVEIRSAGSVVSAKACTLSMHVAGCVRSTERALLAPVRAGRPTGAACGANRIRIRRIGLRSAVHIEVGWLSRDAGTHRLESTLPAGSQRRLPGLSALRSGRAFARDGSGPASAHRDHQAVREGRISKAGAGRIAQNARPARTHQIDRVVHVPVHP